MMISDTKPVCEPIVPRSSVTENEAVDFTCRMTFRWRSLGEQSNIAPEISVSFGWDSETHSNTVLSSSSSSEQTIVRKMTVVGVNKPEIPAQKCTISLTFSPGQSPRYSFATNTVSYTCSSDPIPVRRKFSLYAECDLIKTKLLPGAFSGSAIERFSKHFYWHAKP